MPRRVLVIGASTGYGLASRVTAAFGGDAATLGIFFEKPAEEDRTGSAGWYNSAAFEDAAHAAGLYAKSINGDAFSDEIKRRAIDLIKADLGQVDAVIYSLASPRRTHPASGQTFKSVLKPIGAPSPPRPSIPTRASSRTSPSRPPPSRKSRDTVAVMGGEDWEMWIDALASAGVLAPAATTVAYSYIGPTVTWAIYRNGTIGRAKEDLEAAAARIAGKLAPAAGARMSQSTRRSSRRPVPPSPWCRSTSRSCTGS